MAHLYLSLVTFLLVFVPLFTEAQHLQGWGIYFGNTAFRNSKLSIHHELQLRDYQIVGDHQQTLMRLGLQYQASSAVSLTLGYGYIYTEAEGTPNLPFSENRIYQEASIRQNWNIVRIRHRFRTEERFLKDTFRGRGRYCLFIDVPINGNQMNKGSLYTAFYNEVFLNVFAENTTTFDRNRLYGGFGYKLYDNLGLQLGYMRQHVGTTKGTNHALLSLHHQIKL
ncbi:DUF2490 domain-containing protein [Sphingobacterium sp. LRF_L2]|uniref:DUF2490 domain-containing protein n=1 Tax=Sphingobacterium sp. LRF_L2 TaxID=3369421 RepID=UPI003F61C58E